MTNGGLVARLADDLAVNEDKAGPCGCPHRRFPFLPSTLEPHEQIYYRSKPQTENKRFHSLPPYNALSALLKTRKS
ncbi:hypothetical protein EMEDMD4_1310011 [Sinorhizobium medicae]|uniref:Uncharacterized protein n=1 Tax=Sinorhizobium medicae TaxID=110321 RepID=A0A508WT94_9HYPH|nr:hypothetical protein EMEDMD4_1310011 [Sinorhizobium medicae]